MKRVLVVDDEGKTRHLLRVIVEGLDLEAVPAENAQLALKHFQNERIDLVLTDLKMPGMDGIELLSAIRASDPDVPIIVMTAHGTVETAVDAMKKGAFDFVLKPFDVETVEMVIRRAIETQTRQAENRYWRESAQNTEPFENLVGKSPVMQETYALLRQVAPTKSAVLITGETGTGKELVARAIHNSSPRRPRLFVPINCAAIPAELLESELFGHVKGAFTGAQTNRTGKFEIADGGTLFLDEIGDMPQNLQAKLLRVLEEGVVEPVGSNRPIRVDVRILSSTNRDLDAAIREERFRSDLYYRLNVFRIELPPLRERRDDIAPLATFLLAQQAKDLRKGPLTLDPRAFDLLSTYAWPGNVRELRNLMERVAVLATNAEVDAALVGSLLPRSPLGEAGGPDADDLHLERAIHEVERRYIQRALEKVNGSKPEAAQLLGVSERTLWYKLKKYELHD